MNLEQLEKIKNSYTFSGKYILNICCSTGCEKNSKQQKLKELFANEIIQKDLQNKIEITNCGCLGLCGSGPNILLMPNKLLLTNVNNSDVSEIINHLSQNSLPSKFIKLDIDIDKLDYYVSQDLCLLKSLRSIDPLNICSYIQNNGYFAIEKALQQTPLDNIKIIENSGLRGRGGAGFPTYKKWQIANKTNSISKYVICNADEGDPGAFMDRSLIEGNPHSIIEGMMIAGYCIGANNGIVYIRAEYEKAGEILQQAINDSYKNNLLGKNILNTNFNFDITIKYGAGAFVCGEETALIASCEGKRGEPNKKPPYPAEIGYKNCSTVINNVETLAYVPQIILYGADNFKKFGTKNSPGTKVFCLTGKVKNTGLVEISMGKTINDLVYKIGGGGINGKEIKAVQIGGPSGACIPKSLFDTKIDYDSLKEIGAMMGSGGIIVLDEDSCMVDLAKYFLQFTEDESCGKCTPCRLGNKKLHDILTDICDGNGKISDIDELVNLSNYIKENSLCGLGGSSPNPVLSTIKYFKNEYLEHILSKTCPAGVCKKLVNYKIDDSKCVSCSLCARNCPVKCINKMPNGKYAIDQNKCIKCGHCYNSCRFSAIKRG